MDFTVYFCADGVLRALWADQSRLLPLKFLQEHSENRKSDLRFWSYWSNNTVCFEKGLTIAGFIRALEPWKEYWSDVLDKDLEAYLKELNTPVLVKEDDEALDWACLFSSTEMRAETIWQHDEDENLFDFNRPKHQALSGFWEKDTHYRLSGFRNNVNEHYGIDHLPLNSIANLPLYLSDIENIIMLDYNVEDLAGENTTLLNHKGFGVRQIKSGDSSLKFITCKRTHSLLEVVEGFFWWFARTPEGREEMNNEIREALNTVKESIEEEKKSHLSLVTDNTKLEQEIEQQEEQKLKIKVVPGAFDGLMSSWDKKNTLWDVMWEKYLKVSDNKRIGMIETARPPEHKVYGYTADLEDLQTPFKLR